MNIKNISIYVIAFFITFLLLCTIALVKMYIKEYYKKEMRKNIIENAYNAANKIKNNIGIEVYHNIYLYDANFNKEGRILTNSYLVKGTRKFSESIINWAKYNQSDAEKALCTDLPQEIRNSVDFNYIYLRYEYIDSFNPQNNASVIISPEVCRKYGL